MQRTAAADIELKKIRAILLVDEPRLLSETDLSKLRSLLVFLQRLERAAADYNLIAGQFVTISIPRIVRFDFLLAHRVIDDALHQHVIAQRRQDLAKGSACDA